MKNLKVSLKLTISFAVIFLFFIISIVSGVVGLSNVKTEITHFYNGPYTARGDVNSTKQQFEIMQKSIYMAIGNSDASVTKKAIDEANACTNEIDKYLGNIKNHYSDSNGLLAKFESGLNQIKPLAQKAIEMAANNQNAEAADYMYATVAPVIQSATDDLDEVITDINQNGNSMLSTLDSTQSNTSLLLIVMCSVSIVAGVILCIYITKGITSPLKELKEAAADLSRGNLKTNIVYQSKDEIGQVADSLRNTVTTLFNIIEDIEQILKEMGKGNFDVRTRDESMYVGEFMNVLLSMRHINLSLSETIYQINQSADQVSTGADQMAGGAQILAQGATEQASSVQELAATINNISENVISNAQNAKDANKRANTLGSTIEESNMRMIEMVHSMNEISETSNQINKIIKLIEDIAFQTNILALNAAVEAARAGEAGKGFAVVAGEVRDLASKSAAAASNTTALIENSIVAVKNGAKIADGTANILKSVVVDAKYMITLIDNITSSSSDQADAISQVTEGIDQISKVVQTNSATAEETAASSQELSSHSQLLKSLIDRFKLRLENPKIQDKAQRHSQAVKPPTTIDLDYPIQSLEANNQSYSKY